MNARYVAGCLLGFAAAATAPAGTPSGTTINYEGQLKQNGTVANGDFDFRFRLSSPDAGLDIPIDPTILDGTSLELQVDVKPFDANEVLDCTVTMTDPFVHLGPPQPVTSAPYAIHAFSAANGHALDGPGGNPANALIVDGSGRVGVGTDAPTESLSIAGNATLTDFGDYLGPNGALEFTSNLGDGPPGVRITSKDGLDLMFDSDNNSTNATFRIYANEDHRRNSPLLLMNERGNISIGTGINFDPDHPLEVEGVTNGSSFSPGDPITEIQISHLHQQFSPPTGFVGATAGLNLRALFDHPIGQGRTTTQASIHVEANEDFSQHFRFIAQSANTDMTFETAAGEAMRITSANNFGLGTATPSAKLHVFNGSSGAVALAGSDLILEDDASCILDLMSPDGSQRGISFGSPTNSSHGGIFYANSSGMTLRTGGNQTRLTIDASGDVGIGTVGHSIDARLHVQSADARVAKFDRYGSDGELVAWARDDGVVGNVTASSGVVSYNAFTGSHYAWSNDRPTPGTLVSMNGENRRLSQRPDGEVVYGITTTARADDSACLGAYLDTLPGDSLTSPFDVRLVSAVGNGDMWVADRGAGDIEPGDSLISSDVPGCAMKDDPGKFPVGYVVARAAERVRWADVPADAATGVKRQRTSVLFDSFVRSSAADHLAAEVQQLREETQRQQHEIEMMMSRLDSRIAAATPGKS